MRHYQKSKWSKMFVVVLALFISIAAGLGWQTYSLHNERRDLQDQVQSLIVAVEEGKKRAQDLSDRLALAETRLSQLSTDATGKDAIIKTLQDESAGRQARVDALTAERAALRGCLDGVTLALVQLTNDGSAGATIDGARDVCRKAEVLL